MKNKIFAIGAVIIFAGIFTGCAPEKTDEINADTVLDNEIYKQAVESQNLADCGKILNEEKKKECEAVVEGLNLTDQAVENVDNSICGKITIDRYKENCEALVGHEEAIANIEEAKVEIGQKAIGEKDHSLCNELLDENYKSECILNVLLDGSYSGTDSSECGLITNTALREVCLNDSKWN